MENFSIEKFVELFIDPQTEEFSVYTELDLENQRTITLDVARTKSDMLTAEEKEELERMLTYYCKTEQHTYKQGMNEILVPFLLLGRQGVPKHIIYTCFTKFVARFISTLFRDDFFKPLTGLFLITRLILLYHYPEIQHCFERNQITPDMYMTSWFVTMFAGKLKNLDFLYRLWSNLTIKNEILYLSYFGVALLGYYKNLILEHDPVTFPNVFKKLNIDDFQTLNIIFGKTEEIMNSMPYTAEWVLKKYEIFNLDKTEIFSHDLEKLPCLVVLPRGIICQLYNHDLVCGCHMPGDCEIRRLNYVLIDCRPAIEQKQGNFPNSHMLSKGAQKTQAQLIEYSKKFLNIKHTHHIVLMGSKGAEDEHSFLSSLLKSFMDLNFPHVSIIEGGYLECHTFALEQNLSILQHKPKSCTICCDDNAKKGNIESTLDKFFRLDTTMRAVDILNEKIYKCKISEEQDISTSGIGLIVTSKQIIVIDTTTKEVSEILLIERLTKITCNKNKSEVLSFSFKDNEKKRVWILDNSEVKEFLTKVRSNYSDLKKVKNTIKQII